MGNRLTRFMVRRVPCTRDLWPNLKAESRDFATGFNYTPATLLSVSWFFDFSSRILRIPRFMRGRAMYTRFQVRSNSVIGSFEKKSNASSMVYLVMVNRSQNIKILYFIWNYPLIVSLMIVQCVSSSRNKIENPKFRIFLLPSDRTA